MSNSTTHINHPSEVRAIGELVGKSIEPKLITLAVEGKGDPVPVLVHGAGVGVTGVKKYLDEWRTAPERRKGTATLCDLDSFIAHAKRFSDGDSALFADDDRSAPSLTCVFDYHRKTAAGAPQFCEHRAVYSFPVSDEWKVWTQSSGRKMSQHDFAEFIENHILGIADPSGVISDSAKVIVERLGASFASPSTLLGISRSLSVSVNARVKNASNLSTGEAQIQYEEQHSDASGGQVKVPSAFALAIPVFRNGPLYQLPVRLRYRVSDGKIVWFFEVHGSDRVFDHAFKEACDRAGEETKLPLFVGSPEEEDEG